MSADSRVMRAPRVPWRSLGSCPDELMKWEIRKEMLELDVLINPDYTCLPQPDCGCCNPVQLTPKTCGS